MLEHEAIEITAVRAALEEKDLVISITVRNRADRTVHAYGSPRRVLYDNATRKLTLELHDHGHGPEEEKRIEQHLKQPRVVPLEGGTETTFKVKLPTVIHRLRPAAERGTGALFEDLRISEAKEIELEIAHQDTPFYYNPKVDNLRQLRTWGRVIAKARLKLPEARREEQG